MPIQQKSCERAIGGNLQCKMAEDLDDDFGSFDIDEDNVEPLFGDGLDDPPPLPPPMPSLSQIRSNHTVREGGRQGGVELQCSLFVAGPWTLAWDDWRHRGCRRWRCRGWGTSASGWKSGSTSEEEEASAHSDHR